MKNQCLISYQKAGANRCPNGTRTDLESVLYNSHSHQIANKRGEILRNLCQKQAEGRANFELVTDILIKIIFNLKLPTGM